MTLCLWEGFGFLKPYTYWLYGSLGPSINDVMLLEGGEGSCNCDKEEGGGCKKCNMTHFSKEEKNIFNANQILKLRVFWGTKITFINFLPFL